jgi:hypothetical protein
MGLHAWSISYCDHVQSDGFIPMGSWPALPGVRAAVAALQRSGLWEVCDGGYRLHDYLDYNRSRAQIAEIVQTRREVGRAGALAKAKANGLANDQQKLKQRLKQTPTPGPGDAPKGLVSEDSVSTGFGASPPTPSPSPDGGWPNEAAPRAAAAHSQPDAVASAMAQLYGPPVKPERLPNGAQQCPLCPDIFTTSYAEHLDSPRHKVRAHPDDLRGFHA